MKQNNSQSPATKQDLDDLRTSTKQDLDDLRTSTKKDLVNLRASTKQDLNELRDELTERIETSGTRFRNDILTRLDDIVLQLRDLREDRDVTVHHTHELRNDVDNHEQRIKKIEKVIHTT